MIMTERERFEVWYKKHEESLGGWAGKYYAWLAWQARCPDGWQCVPVEATEEMVDAASDAYMPFGDMALAIQAAIAYAPEDDQRTAPKLATRA